MEQFYTIVHDLHSYLRWLVLFFLLLAVIKACMGWFGNKPYGPMDNKTSLFAMVFTHLQFLLGLVLYILFMNQVTGQFEMGEIMKNPALRFGAVEHITIMLVAVVLVTLGRSLSKRAKTDQGKHKRAAIFFAIGLLVMLAGIPWDRLFTPTA